MREASPPRVAAVGKAMRIVHAFGPHVVELSVRQIAERTGIPRSTAHSTCATLCDGGLLESVPGGRYRLGPALVELGGQVIARTGLVAAAERILPALAETTAGEAHLGQLVGGWVVYLARVPMGGRPIPMRNQVGLRAPAHLSGCGKAALAHLHPDEVSSRLLAVCRAEARPLPDRVRLDDELRHCRERGFLLSASFQAGRASVAAPVFDATGGPVGGVSVAGLASTFTPSVVAAVAQQVLWASDSVSSRLGAPGRASGTTPTGGAGALPRTAGRHG